MGRSIEIIHRMDHAPFHGNTVAGVRYSIHSQQWGATRKAKMRTNFIVSRRKGCEFSGLTEHNAICPEAVDQSFKRSKRDDRLCEGLARSATAAKMLR